MLFTFALVSASTTILEETGLCQNVPVGAISVKQAEWILENGEKMFITKNCLSGILKALIQISLSSKYFALYFSATKHWLSPDQFQDILVHLMRLEDTDVFTDYFLQFLSAFQSPDEIIPFLKKGSRLKGKKRLVLLLTPLHFILKSCQSADEIMNEYVSLFEQIVQSKSVKKEDLLWTIEKYLKQQILNECKGVLCWIRKTMLRGIKSIDRKNYPGCHSLLNKRSIS